MKMPEDLDNLLKEGSLRSQDYFFADFIGRACGFDDKNLLLAAALVSHAVGNGSVCLDLEEKAGAKFPIDDDVESEATLPGEGAVQKTKITLPTQAEWLESLNAAQAAACIGKPGAPLVKPLVLDGHRLYLYRYWRYERAVAAALSDRAKTLAGQKLPGWFGARLAAYFTVPDKYKDNESAQTALNVQKLAALSAFRNRLTLISGGPGTGKTFTIASVLALLVEQAIETKTPIRIRLAAPTGKAAMRMVESIRKAKQAMQLEDSIRKAIPEEASTLHRLLGTVPGSPYFRHNAENPLNAEVVIVDEASMIDLPIMAKLIDALTSEARLILLGDMNQLVSIEPGHVFGDICSAASAPMAFSPAIHKDYRSVGGQDFVGNTITWDGKPGLGDCLVKLDFSFRFPPEGPIGRISEAIINHNPDAAWSILSTHGMGGAPQAGDTDVGIAGHLAPESLYDNERRPLKDLRHAILAGYKAYLDAETLEQSFKALGAFRMLSAFRKGRYGINSLNRLIEDVLSLKDVKRETMSEEYKPKRALAADSEFYERRPILITKNDYSLNLFNGDIGIVLDEQTDATEPVSGMEKIQGSGGRRRVAYFERTDKDGKPTYEAISVNMLPPHETAFAMTIHKIQGSEFGQVLILLPPKDHKFLTRDLLYTAITRAKTHVELWCTEEIVKAAVLRKTMRASGLGDALRNAGNAPA